MKVSFNFLKLCNLKQQYNNLRTSRFLPRRRQTFSLGHSLVINSKCVYIEGCSSMAWIHKADCSGKKRKALEDMEKNAQEKHALKMGRTTVAQQLAAPSVGGAGSGSSSSRPQATHHEEVVVDVDYAASDHGSSGRHAGGDRSRSPSEQKLIPESSPPPGAAAAIAPPPVVQPPPSPQQPPSPPSGGSEAGATTIKESEPAAKDDHRCCTECGKQIPSSCGDKPEFDHCVCVRCPMCWERVSKTEDNTEVLDCMHVSWLGQCLLDLGSVELVVSVAGNIPSSSLCCQLEVHLNDFSIGWWSSLLFQSSTRLHCKTCMAPWPIIAWWCFD